MPAVGGYVDGLLEPGESLTLSFVVCLRKRARLRLRVDVFAVHGPEMTDNEYPGREAKSVGPKAANHDARYSTRRSCLTQSTSIVQLFTDIGDALILAKFSTANSGSGNWSPCPWLR